MKKLIAVEDLQLGMETASAVLNKFGQVLLSQNLRVEEKHFNILRTWGIKTLEIKDYSASNERSESDESLLTKIRSDLKSRLGWSLKMPNEKDLFEMAVQKIFEDNKNGGQN